MKKNTEAAQDSCLVGIEENNKLIVINYLYITL